MQSDFATLQSSQRQTDLAAMLADARALRAYAIETGRAPDRLLQQLASAISSLVNDPTSSTAEENVLKAHAALCHSVAPVTAATLRRSRDFRWPRLHRTGSFLPSLDTEGFHIGRFFHGLFFFALILLTAVVLVFESNGRSLLEAAESTRCEASIVDRQVLRLGSTAGAAVATPMSAASLASSGCAARPLALEAAQRALDDGGGSTGRIDTIQKNIHARIAEDNDRLATWLDTACRFMPGGICKTKSSESATAGGAVQNSTMPPAASSADRTSSQSPLPAVADILARLREVVLPLLLGLLGAYCYVIRSMSSEVKAGTFAPGSFLQHMSKLSLGALAGIVAGWIISPSSLQASAIPVNAMAFIAGFGSEGIFELVERLAATLLPSRPHERAPRQLENATAQDAGLGTESPRAADPLPANGPGAGLSPAYTQSQPSAAAVSPAGSIKPKLKHGAVFGHDPTAPSLSGAAP